MVFFQHRLLIGSHVPMTKNQGYLLGSLATTLANGANCCMIYTGAPQNTRRVATELLNIAQFQKNCQVHRINLKHVIVHAPYIVNLANPSKPQLFAYSARFLSEEIARVAQIGAEILVLHPGSHGGTGVTAGLQSLVAGLNQILTPDLPVKIAIETMAGRKNEIGSTFEQIQYIIQHVRYPEMVGVC